MSQAEKLEENYCCPKCSHTTCCIREVVLPEAAITRIIIPKAGSKFLIVTCALCGYSEMYDTAVFVESPARKKSKKNNMAAESS